MKKRIIILCVAIAGCSPEAAVDATPEAKTLAKSFFSNFSPDKIDKLSPLYGEQFWEAMPKETCLQVMPNVYDELGAIERCDLTNWNQTTQANFSSSGNFVALVYSCKHEKYESTISFTILKPLTGGPAKIVGQNFSSLGLLLE